MSPRQSHSFPKSVFVYFSASTAEHVASLSAKPKNIYYLALYRKCLPTPADQHIMDAQNNLQGDKYVPP